MTYTNIVKMFLLLPLIAFGLYYCTPTESKQQNETQPTKVAKKVDQKQLQCMADNIYYEAGSEPTEGKAAVARVVLNRVNHGFAETPCKVVYQTTRVKRTTEDDETFWVKLCQFSWVCEGKGNPNKQSTRYQNSLKVAHDVLAYDAYKDVIPKTVLFFHNTSITNKFPHEVVARIGNHVFYKKSKNVNRKQNRNRKVATEGRIQLEDVPG